MRGRDRIAPFELDPATLAPGRLELVEPEPPAAAAGAACPRRRRRVRGRGAGCCCGAAGSRWPALLGLEAYDLLAELFARSVWLGGALRAAARRRARGRARPGRPGGPQPAPSGPRRAAARRRRAPAELGGPRPGRGADRADRAPLRRARGRPARARGVPRPGERRAQRRRAAAAVREHACSPRSIGAPTSSCAAARATSAR